MKKIAKAMLCVAMGAMALLPVGCSKDDGESSPSASEEGIYLGVIGFNSQLYVKDIRRLDGNFKDDFVSFIYGLSSGNYTGLYYADYTALQKLEEFPEPPKLKNVALVTFTDGLDNASISNDELNPENYNSASAYREALHKRITEGNVHGQRISAYTIGLKGSDVGDEAVFMENLRQLASSENNVFQVANMNEAMQRFSQIAADLYSVSTSVNLGVDVPGGYDDGQLLRFTFDAVGAATSSARYVEATFRRSGSTRSLDGITYHGLAQGPTSITATSQQGVSCHFEFSNLAYADGSSLSQADLNRIMLWKRTSSGGWDKESEFDPASSSTVTEEKSSALIMLVLDCTTSLGSDFSKMQQGGINFVNALASSNTSGGGNTNWGVVPQDAIDGLYSVSESAKVYFSKGNLVYSYSSSTYVSKKFFSDKQWTYLGSSGTSIDYYTAYKIDLLGWGKTSQFIANNSYYTDFTDWGTDIEGSVQWRTLDVDEWYYLLETRSTPSGIRFAKGTVNGVQGLILLPDSWSTSYRSLSNANNWNASFSGNAISASVWTSTMEANGAVFLPCAGDREGRNVYDAGNLGWYWTSTPDESETANAISFGKYNGEDYNGYYIGQRSLGGSVRLVTDY